MKALIGPWMAGVDAQGSKCREVGGGMMPYLINWMIRVQNSEEEETVHSSFMIQVSKY